MKKKLPHKGGRVEGTAMPFLDGSLLIPKATPLTIRPEDGKIIPLTDPEIARKLQEAWAEEKLRRQTVKVHHDRPPLHVRLRRRAARAWRALKRRFRGGGAIRVSGNVTIDVHDAETGVLLERQEKHNVVSGDGLDFIRDLLANEPVGFLQYFAVGTGTTAESGSDTALETEVYRAQVTQFERTTGRLTVKFYLGTQAANGFDLTEGGVLNEEEDGTLFGRFTYTAVPKTASNTVTYTWHFDFAAV